jgi:raffinose/stachyose/melibiose transport system permease protein
MTALSGQDQFVEGQRRGTFGRSMLNTLVAGLISLSVLFPLLWIISTSLKDRSAIARDPLGLPPELLWENYTQAWNVGNFGTYFVNSVLVLIPTVAAILLLSLLAAYAFAMFTFRGKNALFVLFIGGMTIPLGILIIPLFYQMVDMKLINTLWALILPQTAISLPFGILLLRGFIQELPTEILDAARIDGCGEFGLLRYVITPLTRPALQALLVFMVVWNWNQFLLPMMLIQRESARTLPLGLSLFMGRYGSDFPLLMAGATISFIPVVIVYIIFQRHFIKGIAAGALSGV